MSAGRALSVSTSPHAFKRDEAAHLYESNIAVYPSTKNKKDSSKSQTHEKQSLGFIWRSGLAGGLAGSAAKTIVAPLDRVKILFQSSNPQFSRYAGSWLGVVTAIRQIKATDGISGLFRGHSATIIRIFPYAAIKFLTYEQIRSFLISSPTQETSLRRLLSGSLAGVASVFFTYPLEVIRVRLAFETKKGASSSFSRICKIIYNEVPPSPQSIRFPKEAVKNPLQQISQRNKFANFYRGFSVTVIGMLPYAGMSFLTHDTIGDIFRQPKLAPYTTLPRSENTQSNKPLTLRSWAELCAGGIAGVVSQTSAYPFEVVRRRMQVSGAVGDGHPMRIKETACLIFREKGIRGYWVGLTIGYVKMVPMVAVSFYVYERVKSVLKI
ncbi:Mitochondrial carrier protein LEU5 [Erysiphe necator]|nr:Mitochondrial carrier protein LEU5 [Erysiphe necator]